MSCPYCNHNVLKDMMVKNFVGIATGLDGRNVVVMECPKCFEYWNYHLRQDIHMDNIIIGIELGYGKYYEYKDGNIVRKQINNKE